MGSLYILLIKRKDIKIKFIFIIFIETISVGYFILLYSLYLYRVTKSVIVSHTTLNLYIHDEYYT